VPVFRRRDLQGREGGGRNAIGSSIRRSASPASRGREKKKKKKKLGRSHFPAIVHRPQKKKKRESPGTSPEFVALQRRRSNVAATKKRKKKKGANLVRTSSGANIAKPQKEEEGEGAPKNFFPKF